MSQLSLFGDPVYLLVVEKFKADAIYRGEKKHFFHRTKKDYLPNQTFYLFHREGRDEISGEVRLTTPKRMSIDEMAEIVLISKTPQSPGQLREYMKTRVGTPLNTGYEMSIIYHKKFKKKVKLASILEKAPEIVIASWMPLIGPEFKDLRALLSSQESA